MKTAFTIFIILLIQGFFILGEVSAQELQNEKPTINSSSLQSMEKGFLPVRNYSSLEYGARPQNWAVARDHRGIMYFGNNEGILEYDGTKWRLIGAPDEAKIRSLDIDTTGRIYVGTRGNFGFLAPDSTGKLGYHSLIHKLKEKDKDFGDVWRTVCTDKGVYFQSSDIIFRYTEDTIKVWHAELDAETDKSFHFLFYANETVYVRQRGIGLKKMIDDRLIEIQGGGVFADEKIYFLTDFGIHTDGSDPQILMNTRSQGLFMMTPTPKDYFPADRQNPEHINQITPFKTDIDAFLIENLIYNGIPLHDNTYSIGTLGDGLVVLDVEGNLTKILNKNTGLQDNTIYDQYLDDKDVLWVALANGVSKVEINSPVTFFNDKAGLEGTIQAITRQNGDIYVATLLGVYYLPSIEERLQHMEVNPEGLEAYEPMFNKVAGITTECWALLSYKAGEDEVLLIASNTGIWEIDNGKLAKVVNYDTWKIYRSKADPSRVYLGTSSGLASLYRKSGEWIDEGEIDGIEFEVQNMYEDDDENLWLATGDELHKMRIASFVNNSIDEIELTSFDTTSGLPAGYVSMLPVGDKMIFASDGMFTYDPGTHTFKRSDIFGERFLDESIGIHRMSKDPSGNVWMVTYSSADGKIGIGYVNPRDDDESDDPEWVETPFMGISKEIKHAIYNDEDGVTWLGGPKGLFRFDAKVEKDYDKPYFALIRKVKIGKDSVLFWGTNFDETGAIALDQLISQIPILPYAFNAMEFEFAAPSFQEGFTMQFSYYLEGFDKGWSDWSTETKKEYTNLPENDYKFRVKAIDTYNHLSSQAVYGFTIKPPWHRTIWAYIAYVLSFIGFVYAAITVSTRGLQKIIKQKTADIVAQKEEIEEKNKDITDSINYAQKIQEAILPSAEDIRKHLPESFVLFKPKDIVSGDFYWFSERDGKAILTAADCTGHGVPGAFMSMIGNSLLNEIVNEQGITEPAKILQQLKLAVIKSLKQTGEAGTQKDGMDIAMVAFDTVNMKLEFSGAYNPLFRIRDNELEETRSDRMPIGVYSDDGGKIFTNYPMDLKKGDMYYFFTDGFIDQFGGPKGKKFMNKRFKELLMDMHQEPMEEQKQKLDTTIEDWKAHHDIDGSVFEQMDDILVIGVRV